MTDSAAIHSSDFWVKVVEMLQNNWALIEADACGTRVYFINDASGVFDEIVFSSADMAVEALSRNGFMRLAANIEFKSFLNPPGAPFRRVVHPNGSIYSSGRFWR